MHNDSINNSDWHTMFSLVSHEFPTQITGVLVSRLCISVAYSASKIIDSKNPKHMNNKPSAHIQLSGLRNNNNKQTKHKNNLNKKGKRWGEKEITSYVTP